MPIPKILPAGDRALVAEFGDSIQEETNDLVHALEQKIEQGHISGITETVPTFRSLLIYYDPSIISGNKLRESVLSLCEHLESGKKENGRILEIPCCYGSHFGQDLPDSMEYTNLTMEEIISIHSSVDYKIYMLGFLPGFVYLGGLDKRIEMPRLKTPRTKIPKGAVGIGGNQTGVYPLDSPGGWRLIGSTPVDFYDPSREEPVLCRAGDYIRFVPITSCDYYDIRQMIQRGTYQLSIRSCTDGSNHPAPSSSF